MSGSAVGSATAEALAGALRAIADRYGKPTAAVAAIQLDYRFNG